MYAFDPVSNSESQELIRSSLQAPIKCVPLSDRNCLSGPRRHRNLLKALIKLEDDIDSHEVSPDVLL